MKVFITGGAGFIGSHLADALLERGDEVMVLDDLSTGRMENISHLVGRPGFDYRIGSALDSPLVVELVDRCDVTVHLAAAVGVRLIVERRHTNTGRIPTHHAYIEISIPATVQVERLDVSTVLGWDAPGYAVSRAIGDAWYDSGRSAVLVVPSVVSQVDSNVLIHQEHADFPEIQASEPRPVRWDQRLFRDC